MKKVLIFLLLACVAICAAPNSDNANSKTLVIYYSQTGTTAKLAQRISEKVGGDIIALDSTGAASVSPSNYDILFIGTPVWNDSVATPMINWLKNHSKDFKGKTVVPFCTWWTTQAKTTLDQIMELTPKAKHLEGLDQQHGKTADVEAFLKKIKLLK